MCGFRAFWGGGSPPASQWLGRQEHGVGVARQIPHTVEEVCRAPSTLCRTGPAGSLNPTSGDRQELGRQEHSVGVARHVPHLAPPRWDFLPRNREPFGVCAYTRGPRICISQAFLCYAHSRRFHGWPDPLSLSLREGSRPSCSCTRD